MKNWLPIRRKTHQSQGRWRQYAAVRGVIGLVSLGLDRVKAERSLQRVLDDRKNDPPALEESIRLTLKNS